MDRAETITARQIRAARAVLNWSQSELADRSGIARRTLTSIENGQVKPFIGSFRSIRAAFEEAGIRFVTANGQNGVLFSDD